MWQSPVKATLILTVSGLRIKMCRRVRARSGELDVSFFAHTHTTHCSYLAWFTHCCWTDFLQSVEVWQGSIKSWTQITLNMYSWFMSWCAECLELKVPSEKVFEHINFTIYILKQVEFVIFWTIFILHLVLENSSLWVAHGHWKTFKLSPYAQQTSSRQSKSWHALCTYYMEKKHY